MEKEHSRCEIPSWNKGFMMRGDPVKAFLWAEERPSELDPSLHKIHTSTPFYSSRGSLERTPNQGPGEQDLVSTPA